MDEKELRGLLLQRLHMELLLFKDSILLMKKEDIFTSSYKIEVYVNLYEVLVELVEHLKEHAMRTLLNLSFGILDSFYQEWMEREDGFYFELSAYVHDRLELISEMGRADDGSGKEDTDGAGQNQAA